MFRRALGASDVAMPGASMKLEGAASAPIGVGAHRGAQTLGPDRFFDQRAFDPDASPIMSPGSMSTLSGSIFSVLQHESNR